MRDRTFHSPLRKRNALLASVCLPVTWWVVGLGMIFSVGCESAEHSEGKSDVKPAVVEKLPVETELATVRLTADAERRLGIQSVAVEKRNVSQRRTLAGEAMAPLGNSLIVSSPVPGIVAQHGESAVPLPGAQVERGDVVMDLVPLLSPERDVMTPGERVQLVGARANLVATQETAHGDVERSRAEVEAAEIALTRAEKLFEDGAGARKAVDDATAQLNIAESNLQAATQREQQLSRMLDQLKPQHSTEEATPLELTAPMSGVVRGVNVRVGQTVSVNSSLFEIVNLETIWVRVPVFVDLLPTIAKDKNATLVSLSGQPFPKETIRNDEPLQAHPIAAPPSADPLSSSADLYYEIDNRALGLRPGQRVGVDLPLVGAREAHVVPSASIIYDIYGGAWVYAVTGEREYTRQRVAVMWVEGNDAILQAGPSMGAEVVSAGAAELFGTEFGAGK